MIIMTIKGNINDDNNDADIDNNQIVDINDNYSQKALMTRPLQGAAQSLRTASLARLTKD